MTAYLEIAVKLLIGMICVLIFLRFSGKTQLTQLSPMNAINMIIIGTLVGGTIYTEGYAIVLKMLFAFVIWILINLLVRLFSKNNRLGHMIHGQTEILIKNGKLNLACLKRNNMTVEQLIAKLRSTNVFSLLDIDDVIFETDGSFTIFKKKDFPESYLLVTNGEVREQDLEDAAQTKKWLLEELSIRGFKQIEDLICVQWTVGEGFYIVDNEGAIHRRRDEDLVRSNNKARKPRRKKQNTNRQENQTDKSSNKSNKSENKTDEPAVKNKEDVKNPRRTNQRRRRPAKRDEATDANVSKGAAPTESKKEDKSENSSKKETSNE